MSIDRIASAQTKRNAFKEHRLHFVQYSSSQECYNSGQSLPKFNSRVNPPLSVTATFSLQILNAINKLLAKNIKIHIN